MKSILTATLAVLTLTNATMALANENFDKRKAEAVAKIDEQSTKLQEHKNCVNGAATPEALKQCRDSMKEHRQGERMDQLEKRKTRIEERMQKMKAKQGS